MVAADINQDGKIDIITNSGSEGMDGLAWYEMPDDPTRPWIRHDIGGDYWAHAPHKKIYIYENLAGPDNTPTSSDWKEHVILEGYVSHDTVVGDVDGDGDLDIVSKEWTSGSIYYLKNKLIDN